MYKNILVPVDLDDESSWKSCLPKAAAMAEAFGAKLNLMTVVPDFGMAIVAQYFPRDHEARISEEAGKRLADLAREHLPNTVTPEVVIGHGRPYSEILREANERGCDLIMMASHRPELSDYLLGPNSARVVRHAICSVLVVRD
jgi:nucleotide-binding universal stress UspA family protein